VKLLTVDAEKPLPDILAPATGEQWVLVRLHGRPLGLLRFRDRGCTARQLGARIASEFAERILRHLAADSLVEAGASRELPSGVLPPPGEFPGERSRSHDRVFPILTVAVCTRDGVSRLPECLASIELLDYPESRLDVVVVDNVPRDSSAKDLLSTRYPRVRYVVEPRPGLDWARNRAILAARGDVIAFTDDDVSVDAGWARAIGSLFAADPQVEVITGLVVPDEIDSEAQALFEAYGGFGRGVERRYFRGARDESIGQDLGGAGMFGTGANMAFRRTLFDRIGCFDPALDVGTCTNGGGDLEIFFRALKHEATLVYEPKAVVRHRHRRTYSELRTQIRNNGIGFYSYLVRSIRHYPNERAALRMFGLWWFCSWSLRRLARSVVHPGEFPRDLILAELWGSLRGLGRYRRACRHAARVQAAFGPQREDQAIQGAASSP
jgi:glycosyltransferase involved in cell wall biosynthesis